MTLLTVFIVYAIVLAVALRRGGIRPGAAVQHASGRPISRVLVVGATGGTGRQLVAQALERGYSVTAFVRDPGRLTVKHEKLQVITGDVRDYEAVEKAVRGHDAVISALGHKHFWSANRTLSEGTRNILRAMETHGAHRLVCETSLGIADSVGRMGLYYTFFVIPVILPFYFWEKTRQERLIAESNVEWVIVRPGALTNGAGRGSYRHGRDVGNYLWTVRISRVDVADFMLNQLTDDSYLGTGAGVCWQ